MTVKKRVNGRKKGQTAERKLAKLFSDWWGTEFARTPLSGGFATAKFREDWNAAGDLVTPDKSFPFCVESKKVEGWTLEQMLTSDKTLIHKWWEQTVRETPQGRIPLLVFTKNRAPLYAMLAVSNYMYMQCTCFRIWWPSTAEHVVIFPLAALFETDKKLWR